MTSITNTSDTRQPVHTTSGVIWIPAGKTRDVELSAPGRKLIEASDVLAIEAPRRRKRARKASE